MRHTHKSNKCDVYKILLTHRDYLDWTHPGAFHVQMKKIRRDGSICLHLKLEEFYLIVY